MVQNAQSDNEKASLVYQVELFKDKIEDMEEAHAFLQVVPNYLISQIRIINSLLMFYRKSIKINIENVKKPKGKFFECNKN